MKSRKVLFVASVLGLSALAQGCGNACDDFDDAAVAKYRECGLDLQQGEDDSDRECPAEAAELAECLTPCVENLSCGALDGSDPAAATDYAEFAAACG